MKKVKVGRYYAYKFWNGDGGIICARKVDCCGVWGPHTYKGKFGGEGLVSLEAITAEVEGFHTVPANLYWSTDISSASGFGYICVQALNRVEAIRKVQKYLSRRKITDVNLSTLSFSIADESEFM